VFRPNGGAIVIDHAILVEDDSFCVLRGSRVIATVFWPSITEIVLLKRDDNVRDTVGLEFRFKPGNHFPGFDSQWKKRVEILSSCRYFSIFGRSASSNEL